MAKRRSSNVFCLLCVSFLAACSTMPREIAPLFANPVSLSGKSSSACGFLKFGFENHNFYPSAGDAKRDQRGVGVTPGERSFEELKRYHDRKVCLSGRVRYSGCAITSICTGSNFPYEMLVDEIRVLGKL